MSVLGHLRATSWNLLRQPLAWILAAAFLALDIYATGLLARAPSPGATIRPVNGQACIVALKPDSPLARAGCQVGDPVLAIGGRSWPAEAFLADQDESLTWAAKERMWAFQRFLQAQGTTLAIQVQARSGPVTVEVAQQPLGWWAALRRTLAFHVVGWGYLLFSLLVWVKKPDEASLAFLVCGAGVLGTMLAGGPYNTRDLAMAVEGWQLLADLGYLFALQGCFCMLLAARFPVPAGFFLRHPWLRWVPLLVTSGGLLLQILEALPHPMTAVSTCLGVSLAVFMTTTFWRMATEKDPLVRAQFFWMGLGNTLGFFPYLALTAIPSALGRPHVPSMVTLLASLAMPIGYTFAILRYRLLDAESVFDWALIHSILLGTLVSLDLAFWAWLDSQTASLFGSRSIALAASLTILVFLYAPARTWLHRILSRRTRQVRPDLSEALHRFLQNAQALGEPTRALEQTLAWALQPAGLAWIPQDGNEALLARLAKAPEGLLGHQLGGLCPEGMEPAALLLVQCWRHQEGLALRPRGGRSWTRREVTLARMLVLASEPLFHLEGLREEHRRKEARLREQREEIMREMHDGLGSQLFGASLMATLPPDMEPVAVRTRTEQVRQAIGAAIDTLRSGLSVLSAPPGALGPALLAQCMRAEQVFQAAGIDLRIEVQEEVGSLHLDSRTIFGLLRALQEALTNAVRHARCAHATVEVTLASGDLRIRVEDDGIGFAPDLVPAGHGLGNISRRLAALGGAVDLRTAPGQGCALTLSIPLPEEAR